MANAQTRVGIINESIYGIFIILTWFDDESSPLLTHKFPSTVSEMIDIKLEK